MFYTLTARKPWSKILKCPRLQSRLLLRMCAELLFLENYFGYLPLRVSLSKY